MPSLTPPLRAWATAIALIIAGIPSFPARAAEYICPANTLLPKRDSAVSSDGWTQILQQSPLLLSGANVFDGPPSDLASLVPTREAGKGDHTKAIWKFEGDFPNGKWISCDYGSGAAALVRRINDDATQCTAAYDHQRKPPLLSVRFICN